MEKEIEKKRGRGMERRRDRGREGQGEREEGSLGSPRLQEMEPPLATPT